MNEFKDPRQHMPGDHPTSTTGEMPVHDPEIEWDRLRSLLLADEISALEKLQKRLDDPILHAQDVSKVITEALLLRSGKDDRLQAALQGTVENIVKDSVRRNPADFAGQIFPVMGTAIRRAISESFRAMLLGFNKSLEMSFSWKGLRWRLEALRTGKPFSEIVLLHTLVYRVEQIFLIHAQTGLLLDHLANEGAETQDADLVSGMLTAVQDFVRDCFASGGKENLDSLQLGDYTIFVEHLSHASLAYVIRGTPPSFLKDKFREALEVIVLECADLFETFDGDTSGFQKVRRHLEGLLIARFVDEDKKLPLRAKILPVFALVLLLGGGGFFYARLQIQEQRFTEAINALGETPGITVTSVHGRSFGLWEIVCMKDELAPDPTAFLVAAGVPENRFTLRTIPYISLDSRILHTRVAKAITPPETAHLHLDQNNILHFSGEAPSGWIATAREQALTLPGIKGVDTSQISAPDTLRFNEAIQKLNQEPGITVIQASILPSGQWDIACLHDELAMNPSDLLVSMGIAKEQFTLQLTPFMSLDSGIIYRRILNTIQPPKDVHIDFDKDHILHLSGTASMGWTLAAREKALSIAGVKGVNTDQLIDPRAAELQELVNRVEAVSIHFPSNKDTPIPEDMQTLRNAVASIVRIEQLAGEMGMAVSLTIYGHADATGQDKRNYEISQERAKTLAAMLYAKGSSIPISTYGMGADYANHTDGKPLADQASRKIELKVNLVRFNMMQPSVVQK